MTASQPPRANVARPRLGRVFSALGNWRNIVGVLAVTFLIPCTVWAFASLGRTEGWEERRRTYDIVVASIVGGGWSLVLAVYEYWAARESIEADYFDSAAAASDALRHVDRPHRWSCAPPPGALEDL